MLRALNVVVDACGGVFLLSFGGRGDPAILVPLPVVGKRVSEEHLDRPFSKTEDGGRYV